MLKIRPPGSLSLLMLVGCLLAGGFTRAERAWEAEILPPEQVVEVDPASGLRVTFVTTHPAADVNLYFHERCFLADNRLMLFDSDRFGRREVMGYLVETGELVRFLRAEDAPVGRRVASILGDRFYVTRGGDLIEWRLTIGREPRTTVRVAERIVGSLPVGAQPRSSVDENSDGTLLASLYTLNEAHYLGFLETATGRWWDPVKLDFKPDHLQFSRHRPEVVSVSRTYETGGDWAPTDPREPRRARIWTVHARTRQGVPAFFQAPGELATHECWWVNDTMTFIGGFHRDGSREEGAVKVLDFRTGEIRIVGSGAWVEGVPGEQLSQANWWHAAGSPNGRWVVADNWHGMVVLFDARTTEKKVLTAGHRVYGSKGLHPHAGWDLRDRHVQFTSNKRGNPDVCLVSVPAEW